MSTANTLNYLTPYRWYNQFFKQSRFEKDCDMLCGFELLVDKNHLLPFQFTRKANPAPIADWYLRKSCVDPFERLWSEADSNFVTLDNWDIDSANCDSVDPGPQKIFASKTGSDSGVQVVDTTTGNTIGFSVWDTDLATTFQKVVDSINNNTPNGTLFSPGFPFDNSMGWTASTALDSGSTYILNIIPPAASGAAFNGHGVSVYFDGGVWTVTGNPMTFSGGVTGSVCKTFYKDCGNLRSTEIGTIGAVGSVTSLTNLVIGKAYKLYLKVSGWDNPGGNFNVDVYDGAVIIKNYSGTNATGITTVNFTATSTTLHIDFNQQTTGDYIIFDEITIYNPFVFDASTDYTLDKTKLSLQNTGGTTGDDYIIYCGDDLPTIAPGKYYSIIRFLETYDNKEQAAGTYISDGYAYYFSEEITIKDFIPEASPYIKLEWYNDCDIQDVRYASTCYINRLYIDGVLTKPEYPITEKGQNDGNEDFNATFQKWNKKRDLQFTKVPEFLIDSLTAIRLHSTINLWEAVRDKQEVISPVIIIKSVEHEITWILDDCRATFNLKCLIADKVVDETCCENVAVTSCIECESTAEFYNDDSSTDEGATAIFEDFGSYTDGYYIYTGGNWELQTGTEDSPIICLPEDEDDCGMFTPQSNAWQRCPSIFYNLFSTGAVRLKGRILANTYAQAQYSVDAGGTWTDIGLPANKTQFASSTGLQFIRPSDSPACGDTWYRVKMFDLNCEYCISDHVVSTDSSGC